MLAFTSEPSVRYAIPTTFSISHSNHGSIGVWLGCSPRRHFPCGNLVPSGATHTHQPPGAPGCSQGPSVLKQKSCELPYTGQIRQLNSSVVTEPSRGHSLSFPVHANMEASRLVHPLPDLSPSKPPLWKRSSMFWTLHT